MNESALTPDAPLVDAVRTIEANLRRIAVVTSADGRLLGTLTDGDVRRCLLRDGNLQMPVSEAMNQTPITATEGATEGVVIELMRRGNVMAIPIVDTEGRFLRLVHLSDLASGSGSAGATAQFAFAVIMAGGEGRRLRPVTQNIPKPMVEIGGVPLLERQVQRLARAGVSRVYLSVNYLAHIIEEYFGDGARFGVALNYLREKDRLGTAGALSLLPELPSRPIVVMNGDIITTADFAGLSAFHAAQAADVTMAAVDYHVNIPFGVIVAEGSRVTAIREKPAQRFLCNAGIYAISPSALHLIPRCAKFDMTELMSACLDAGLKVSVFPLHEYWSDIGTPDDLEKARQFFTKLVQNNE